MPRSTNSTYLKTHTHLHQLWLQDMGVVACFSPTDQWYLHDYFKLSHSLSDEQLVAHRGAVAAARPSLAQCAGRALAHLNQALESRQFAVEPAAPGGSRRRAGPRSITARSVVKPEIDVHTLAQIIIDCQAQLSR